MNSAKTVIFVVLFIGAAYAGYNKVGRCTYDTETKRLQFYCTTYGTNKYYFDESAKQFTCKNLNTLMPKADVTFITFFYCNMTALPKLRSFENLSELNVSRMGLKNLRADLLEELPHLKKLIATDNDFVEPPTLMNQQNLESLELTSNPNETASNGNDVKSESIELASNTNELTSNLSELPSNSNKLTSNLNESTSNPINELPEKETSTQIAPVEKIENCSYDSSAKSLIFSYPDHELNKDFFDKNVTTFTCGNQMVLKSEVTSIKLSIRSKNDVPDVRSFENLSVLNIMRDDPNAPVLAELPASNEFATPTSIETNSPLLNDQVGNCVYDDRMKTLTLFCFKNESNKYFFDESMTDFTCRNLNSKVARTEVTSIKFANCKMNVLPSFRSFANLLLLDVSKMGLIDMPALDSMPNLDTLIAKNNQLSGCQNFTGLKNLKTLDLSSNPISIIESDKSFSLMDSLQNLNLANTGIKSIGLNAFSHLANLISIDLSNNKLKEFDLNVFMPAYYSLRVINLNNNRIKRLVEAHRQVFFALEIMSIVKNEISCSDLNDYMTKGDWMRHLLVSNEFYSTSIDEINRVSQPVCV